MWLPAKPAVRAAEIVLCNYASSKCTKITYVYPSNVHVRMYEKVGSDDVTASWI